MTDIAWRQIFAALGLPPLLLVLGALTFGLLAWRGRRGAGLLGAAAALGILFLATPAISGLLRWTLEREVARIPAPGMAPSMAPGMAPGMAPAAIIILGAEVTHGPEGPMVGMLTLERLRAGAALHRRTRLPILVTGGILRPGDPPLAVLMAQSLLTDFGTATRWIEPQAGNTRQNALHSAALLRADGIAAALLVSHAWHLPRAMDAFAPGGLIVTPAPLHLTRVSMGRMEDWMPRPDHLAESWYALREWTGRLMHATGA